MEREASKKDRTRRSASAGAELLDRRESVRQSTRSTSSLGSSSSSGKGAKPKKTKPPWLPRSKMYEQLDSENDDKEANEDNTARDQSALMDNNQEGNDNTQKETVWKLNNQGVSQPDEVELHELSPNSKSPYTGNNGSNTR